MEKIRTAKKKTNKIVTKEDEREKNINLLRQQMEEEEKYNEKEKFEWCDRHM